MSISVAPCPEISTYQLEIAVAASRDGITDATVWATVAPLSFG
jgi:hypothetical protein